MDNLVDIHGEILAPAHSKTLSADITSENQTDFRKEFKRKLEQGPVDHEFDVRCKVYENRRVAADAETLRLLKLFSEREIEAGTGLHRSRVRLLRHGGTVTRKTYEKIQSFLRATAVTSESPTIR